jgi:hypothetical protein
VNRLQRLHEAGVSIWPHTRSRELLETGEFERLVSRLCRHRRDIEPDDLRQGRSPAQTATTSSSPEPS